MTYNQFIQSKKYKAVRDPLLTECLNCGSKDDLFLTRKEHLVDLFIRYQEDMLDKPEFLECACVCKECYNHGKTYFIHAMVEKATNNK